MNIENLKENSTHGDTFFPLRVYYQIDTKGEFSVQYHWHDQIEIIYIEKGEFNITVNNNDIIGRPGDLYFINSGDLHEIHVRENKPSLHHAIVFKPEILSFELFDHCQSCYITPILNGKLKFPISIDHNEYVKSKIIYEFNEIAENYDKKSLGWSISIKASLLKILTFLIESNCLIEKDKLNSNNKDKFNILKKIIYYIQENYNSKITIDELAKIANMSPQYFCKFFKSMVGKTAIEYINEYRIEKACKILKTEDVKIMNVCFSVGFDNFSYFIRKFKEYKKCTPSKYKSNFELNIKIGM
ncbi:AraC family transcriptional regulator [Romboutsia ilealis]|uniref:Helix-turn-helix transcriptional regulator n=1 Tax=Romboutsia faecis TaxID=2764597 RepID=A0ABR7JSJ8_9FIRM|nr:AraC family transcriptional regulator [Romboutsia faecis]MBC5997893.1 helix-turn-helix transcriptional regulator [Romboutsia faecis]MRN25588.1 AraC family transcriptional regulator [Romboutsia ilealis]